MARISSQIKQPGAVMRLLPVLLSALMAAVLPCCVADGDGPGALVSPGDMLPAFSVVTDGGVTVSNASLRGKAGVLEFFNTGCPDCRRSLPVLDSVWRHFKGDEGVVVLAISREEDAASVRAWWQAHGMAVPWSAQDGREVYSLFAGSGIPRTFVFGPDGKVTAAYGPDDNVSARELVTAVGNSCGAAE